MADTNSDVWKENVDQEVFQLLVDMDDGEPELEFSKGIIADHFVSAKQTIEAVEAILKSSDLGPPEWRNLAAHFQSLKGASLKVGFYKIGNYCEENQDLANKRCAAYRPWAQPIDSDEVLRLVKERLDGIKSSYEVVKPLMEKYFGGLD